jgi:cyclic pyranopterin phosphate synthase
LGISKIRLTGGEPLLRRGILDLIGALGRHIDSGALAELTLTTNGLALSKLAPDLRRMGIRRVNVSLDTLDPALFRRITGHGDIRQVLAGIAAAGKAGLAVKINTVVLKGVNEDGLDDLIAWTGRERHLLTLIEAMPIGAQAAVPDYRRLTSLRDELAGRWTLIPSTLRTGGPARYVSVAETGGTLGFITPLSGRFCHDCNRIRLSCSGRLRWCLGREDSLDLRALLRATADDGVLEAAILEGLAAKPAGHRFGAAPIGPLADSQLPAMNRMGG